MGSRDYKKVPATTGRDPERHYYDEKIVYL